MRRDSIMSVKWGRCARRAALSFVVIALCAAGYFATVQKSYAAGTVYYVATTGNDKNSGSIDQPFATIAHAASVVGAGDSVYVRGGVYTPSNGTFIGTSGSAAAPITFQSYPGEQAIFDGSSAQANATCLVAGAQYLVLKNFVCRGPWFQGIMVWKTQHVQILSNIVHDTTAYGMLIAGDTFGSVSDVLVSGNTVYHDGGVSNGTGGIDATYAKNVSISGNTIYENRGLGLDINGSDSITMTGNVLRDNTGVEINLNNVSGSTCQQNFVYETLSAASHADGKLPHGIQMGNYSDIGANPLNNNAVVNNIVSGEDTNFMYVNVGRGGGLKNTLIANNTWYGGASGYVVYIDPDAGHSNTSFVNNIFVGTHSGWVGDIPQSAGLLFQHNSWSGGDGSATGGASSSDVNANPQLVAPGGATAASYQLQAASPMRNAGVALSAVTNDFVGTARPQQGSVDIGAYQYGNSTPAAGATPTAPGAGATPTTQSGTPAASAIPGHTPTPGSSKHISVHIVLSRPPASQQAQGPAKSELMQTQAPVSMNYPLVLAASLVGALALCGVVIRQRAKARRRNTQ